MWLGLEVGSAACSCCGLWELLLRNRVTASGMWVRAWPPSRDATPPSFAWDGVKATPEMGWECFNLPYPKRTGPPGSLQPALSLWESWAWCLGFLIALGSCRARGGHLWDMCKDLGLETSQLREEPKPKSLFGFSSSESEESHGQPHPSRGQEKLWSVSRCGGWSYPLGVWGETSCKPPRRFARP